MEDDPGARLSPADKLTGPENKLPDNSSAAADNPITLENELGVLCCGLSSIQINQSIYDGKCNEELSHIHIYAFFEPVPEIYMIDGRVSMYKCAGKKMGLVWLTTLRMLQVYTPQLC